MANTITNLMPDMLEALDTVSRELTGMIPAVSSSMTFERAAVGQTVRSPVAPAAAAGDITPGVTPPNDGDQVIANQTMSITKARRVPIRWNGEESLGLANGGLPRSRLMQDQFAQAMRTLTNEVESDLAGLHIYASRAYGTAGTTPFATSGDFTDASFAKKILLDNGGAEFGNSLVMNTSAGATLVGKQASANVAGTDSIQRQGILLPLAGLDLRQSAQIKDFVKGTGTAYTTSAAGFAVGSTSIAIITGSGTVLAGDTVTFAGDNNKYVVATGVAAPGTIVLAAPGLRVAIAASATAMTILNNSARNMVFNRSAILLATRAPALPEEGDMAVDRQMLTDPRSGLTFEVAKYMQYRQVQYEISLAWGVKANKTEHIGILLG